MYFQILPSKLVKLFVLAMVVSVLGITTVHDSIGQETDETRQQALKKTRIAYEVAWQRAPLDVKTLTFVTEPAEYYGHYHPRGNSVFTVGESMIVYIEPTGFGFGRKGEFYAVDLDIGMELRTPDGKVLLSTNSPERVGLESKTRSMEFQTSLTYTFQDLPAGRYLLYFLVDDVNSHKKGNFELPFTIQ